MLLTFLLLFYGKKKIATIFKWQLMYTDLLGVNHEFEYDSNILQVFKKGVLTSAHRHFQPNRFLASRANPSVQWNVVTLHSLTPQKLIVTTFLKCSDFHRFLLFLACQKTTDYHAAYLHLEMVWININQLLLQSVSSLWWLSTWLTTLCLTDAQEPKCKQKKLEQRY